MSSAVKEQEELRVGAPGKNRMCYGRSVIIPMAVVTDSHQLSGSKQHKLNNSLMVLEAGFLPLTRFTWKALELVGHEQLRLLLQRSHILEGPVILVDSLLLSHRGRPQTEMQPLSSDPSWDPPLGEHTFLSQDVSRGEGFWEEQDSLRPGIIP
ncbi:uncharacterized protein LOC129629324 isoform X2 [Bubalus kerabau]|uniref:uncharacterized protein LOC129629324 isoform X2 n=1 Tax=Bubalus carabanensis TaxID=3119969 RepID=UPI00244E8B71|nr:uncharacterized protein LOC129629324 isoform X2 [Bubalus carabanensis]